MKRFLLKIAGTAGSLKLLTFVTLGLSITAPATLVADQDDANDSNEDLTIEEVLITGSRRPTGSVADIPSPVDVITAEQLTQQGTVNVTELLRTTTIMFC